MLKVGDCAPDFSLLDQYGEPRTLAELISRDRIILYFYPIDFSPVCTAQACAMRDGFEDALSHGVNIVGISSQDVESHRRFADRHGLPFPLLADPQKRVLRAYGVNAFMGLATRRATFLIDRQGIITNRVVSDFFVGPHSEFLAQVARPPDA